MTRRIADTTVVRPVVEDSDDEYIDEVYNTVGKPEVDAICKNLKTPPYVRKMLQKLYDAVHSEDIRHASLLAQHTRLRVQHAEALVELEKLGVSHKSLGTDRPMNDKIIKTARSAVSFSLMWGKRMKGLRRKLNEAYDTIAGLQRKLTSRDREIVYLRKELEKARMAALRAAHK